MRKISRFLTVICLLAGLLAPKGAAVLASAVPGVVQMVICTGHGLDVITIEADGTPRRLAHDLPCGAVHGLVSTELVPLGLPARIAWQQEAGASVSRRAPQGSAYLRPRPRAPPFT